MHMLVQINHSHVNLKSFDIIAPKQLIYCTLFTEVSEEPADTILDHNFVATVTRR